MSAVWKREAGLQDEKLFVSGELQTNFARAGGKGGLRYLLGEPDG